MEVLERIGVRWEEIRGSNVSRMDSNSSFDMVDKQSLRKWLESLY